MSVSTAEELFIGDLREVYQAEKQLVETLPKLVEETTIPALKATLTSVEATKAHVERLVEAFELLDGGRRSRRCEAARNMSDGALHGSSHDVLPPLLRWLTATIGLHHIHHLSSRIPCYRHNKALTDHPELKDVSRLTVRQSIACLKLAPWDENRQLLVAFSDLGR